MTTLILKPVSPAERSQWIDAFHAADPTLTIIDWDDPSVPPETVDYAFAWQPEGRRIAAMPNLRAVISPAAGLDHILRDPAFPRDMPLYRMGTQETVDQMGDYVCWAALTLVRDAWRWAEAQARQEWSPWLNQTRTAATTTVGVMGLGELGRATALRLKALGFQVCGWARSAHHIDGVDTFAGDDAFIPFLNRTDILVSLLPATSQTAGILGKKTFAHLRPQASIISVGRGSQLIAQDLVDAINSNVLRGAVLDVVPQEPLPQDSPLWTCRGVTISPHMASEASYRDRAAYAVSVIHQIEAGKQPALRYDPAKGY
ncbi:D-isomer specific 2-hydroxyacid dehydrogenase [Neoasaia chiangmaiensis NBRC 101099]|uniref:Uncharacterized protein n=1 Tax=Neoasaia chiangmaiensis TaxID=320497 RepID=A0A1U9KP03_9PROT|nr:glyoxylate/hydroxypyruvate reductase A [Neoasaia chiangmaiensis]AQS87524.1 hypothetical protein A0U93_05760 [Neoasaia chiangmaiensis]GBR42402.1 D-isomer specific 2-hydroxyacid dehydrogenase [Neoasaia chiangmaiensis NBRC 101099]GEN14062.1 glyoxylate/hydroxypyruvate reductase A [Neoasaia chiangmaiensis]